MVRSSSRQPPSDGALLRQFCALVDDYDRLCEVAPSSVSTFDLDPDLEVSASERSVRLIRAMALRKFAWGEDAVRGDNVVAALQRSLTSERDRLSIAHWHETFAAIGTAVQVDEGGPRPVTLPTIVEDLVYGGLLHSDYDRWLRTSGRSHLSTDLAIWMFTQDTEFFVRQLRNLIRVAERERRLDLGSDHARPL